MIRQSIFAIALAAAFVVALATGARATGIVAQTYTHPRIDSGTALGAAVASLGQSVVLGAPDSGSLGCPFDGAVLVFDGETGTPLLEIVDEGIDRCFSRLGWAVAEIDGDILASAPFRTDRDISSLSGAVYRFDGTTGALEQTFLHHGDHADPDVFGSALVVADGDVWIGSPAGAAVPFSGAPPSSGAVYRFDVATGDLLGSLTSPS